MADLSLLHPQTAVPAKDLTAFFRPRNVAVIGASANPQKIGYQILENIIEGGYEGNVFPIHPTEKEILGRKAYASISEVPEDIDLAVFVIPAAKVPEVFKECAGKNVRCAAIISSGFSEVGNSEPEEEIKRMADEHNISVLGPNMFGTVYKPSHLNASFGPRISLPGKIAFVTQSGALGISLMGWAEMEHIGMTALVSVGNKIDVSEKELIEYFNNDEHVDVILIYMEGIKNARKFMATKIQKPVVVLKAGRSERGAKAAASHTGSLAGADQVYDAAFKQLGILRAGTFTEAFGWSRALSLPEPRGENTLIITNGGGIGVRTTDECEQYGLKLLDDPQWLEEKFRSTMPSFGSTKNPVDITGQADAEAYARAVRIALAEDRIHTVIVLNCETTVTDPINIARAVEKEYEQSGRTKPLITAMVGGTKTRQALKYLNERRIPAFSAVGEAVSALNALYLWENVRLRADDPAEIEAPPQEAIDIIERARERGQKSLLEHEAYRVFELCGVAVPPWGFAGNMDEALQAGQDKYPLAMKIASPDILHKSEVDGVALNIRNDAELLLKYHNMMKRIGEQRPDARLSGVNLVKMVKGIECIVGLHQDAQFGPTVMFGLGGVFVEALKTVSFRVAPFGLSEARRLIKEIKGANILEGFRGMKADIPSIVRTIMAVQRLAPYVKEIDINPLMSNEEGSFAVDARVIL